MRPLPFLAATLAATLVGEPATAQCGPSPEMPIQLEIDYMVAPDHSHRPTQLELDAIVQMFACHDIDVVIELDDAVPEFDTIQCPDPLKDEFFNCAGPLSWSKLVNDHFDHKNDLGWHYVFYGHRFRFDVLEEGNEEPTIYDGLSGVAITPGPYVLVTMGAFTNQVGTPFDRAGTLAHELGHSLGLGHYPYDSVASPGPPGPIPANYPSIMSYRFQLRGIRSQLECLGLLGSAHRIKELDYSNGRFPSVSELALSEALGIGIHPVDWNCDGVLTSGLVSAELDDVGSWCGPETDDSYLRDQDDWSRLVDVTWCPSDDSATAQGHVSVCAPPPSPSGLDDFQDPALCAGTPQPTLTVEPCELGRMVWVDKDHAGPQIGTGDLPYSDFWNATVLSTNHSVLYLQPGTYSSDGPVVIDRPFTITGPGSAVIVP